MACAKSEGACKVDFAKSLLVSNNPAPHTGQGDSTHYWTDQVGNILQLKFPAVITTAGTNSKIEPYFNLLFDGVSRSFHFLPSQLLIMCKINVKTLKKTQAQFQVHPLSPHEYPEEAVACSAATLNGLLYMCSTLEDPGKSCHTVSTLTYTMYCRQMK